MARELRITIAMDNDGFQDAEGEAVALILRELAEKIERNGKVRDDGHIVQDMNGNTVGRAYAVKSED